MRNKYIKSTFVHKHIYIWVWLFTLADDISWALRL